MGLIRTARTMCATNIQVGQCGNQIGCRFWELALQEHATHTKGRAIYEESMSTFFRNTDGRTSAGFERDLSIGDTLKRVRARAVLVDMEEGVVNRVMRSSLGSLFKGETQSITAPSGAGNNWAFGHMVCGPEYEEEIMERVRRQAEVCDSLQSFFVLHSLGGGTGSGLGTYLLRKLRDTMPKVCRFCVSVFPSKDDDVITSPYNSMFALSELAEHADCVLPIENQALMDLSGAKSDDAGKIGTVATVKSPLTRVATRAAVVKSIDRTPSWSVAKRTHDRKGGTERQSAYDSMNHIAASLITDLTCSSRFEVRIARVGVNVEDSKRARAYHSSSVTHVT